MTVFANVTSSSLVSFFLLMARVTTHAGYRPGILFSTGSGDLSELGFSVTIALTTTLFTAGSFLRIRCTQLSCNIFSLLMKESF